MSRAGESSSGSASVEGCGLTEGHARFGRGHGYVCHDLSTFRSPWGYNRGAVATHVGPQSGSPGLHRTLLSEVSAGAHGGIIEDTATYVLQSVVRPCDSAGGHGHRGRV